MAKIYEKWNITELVRSWTKAMELLVIIKLHYHHFLALLNETEGNIGAKQQNFTVEFKGF
jgi:hypothetical protein